MNSENLSKQASRVIPRWLPIALTILSLIGFIDATYLTAKHYLGSPVTCLFLGGCEKVTNSQYATIYGVPVALLGAFYYLFVFLCLVAYFDTKKERILDFIAYFSIAGFLASLYFLYLQIFIIKALCFYCLISAAASILIFVLSARLYRWQSFVLEATFGTE